MRAFSLTLCLGLIGLTQALGQLERQNVSEDINAINKSLEDLLGELSTIRREATGRLSSFKNLPLTASASNPERIRQTKVSRYVLNRVSELESESITMRDEIVKLFQLQQLAKNDKLGARQEDIAFEELTSTTQRPSSSSGMPSSQATTTSEATTTTLKPEDEAAKIGFDLEALKKLGAELESEIEARQQQTPESLRGVHEQVIKLVDNMVQNYLGNMRRAVQRITNLLGNRRPAPSRPVEAMSAPMSDSEINSQLVDGYMGIRNSVLNRIQLLSTRMHEFTMQWTKAVGKQQSPLLDRIPSRGIELWRDFWDTVHKQVRRINQEFRQLSQDMGRLLTRPRVPAPSSSIERSLLYAASSLDKEVEQVGNKFQEFYDKMSLTLSAEQAKLDKSAEPLSSDANTNYLIEESDDEKTRDELTRNVALRQQIHQEINVFGSIFDIMREFIKRLRESAQSIRNVIQPGAPNDNNPVTPGPAIRPQVEKLLDEMIDSQRNINSQGKPAWLPNSRPVVRG